MARAGFSVNVVDKGLKGLLAKLTAQRSDAAAEIGVIDPIDAETAMIARVHELGLGNNPQRSFLRATIATNRQRYVELSRRAFAKFMDGKWTMAQAMGAIGAEIKSDIQRTIIKGVAPKLQEATIKSKKRKGLPRPRTALYATGKLYESIKFRLKGVR